MPSSRSSGMVVASAIAGLLASLALVAAVSWVRSTPEGAPLVEEAGRSDTEFRQDRAAILRTAPRSQAAALADHRITAAEYEAAVRAAMRCLVTDLTTARTALASHPPTFIGPSWSGDRFTYAYEFQLVVDDLDPRLYDRSCQQRHSRSVEALFHLQRWADRAYLERVGASFHACLDDAGLPGRTSEGPRARFRAVITAPEVGAQAAIEARKCIGAHPSIGDLNP